MSGARCGADPRVNLAILVGDWRGLSCCEVRERGEVESTSRGRLVVLAPRRPGERAAGGAVAGREDGGASVATRPLSDAIRMDGEGAVICVNVYDGSRLKRRKEC